MHVSVAHSNSEPQRPRPSRRRVALHGRSGPINRARRWNIRHGLHWRPSRIHERVGLLSQVLILIKLISGPASTGGQDSRIIDHLCVQAERGRHFIDLVLAFRIGLIEDLGLEPFGIVPWMNGPRDIVIDARFRI